MRGWEISALPGAHRNICGISLPVLPSHAVVMGNVVSFHLKLAGSRSRESSRVTGRGRINHRAGKEQMELTSDTLEEPQYCRSKNNKKSNLKTEK